MTRIVVSREIQAAAETVFEAVSDIPNLPRTNPDVLRIEILSEQQSGVGTRFREIRRMKGNKEMVTELEVTEYAPPSRIRMVADSHGTVWDTVYTIEASGPGITLTLAMDANAHKLLPRLMNPIMKGFFRRGIEKYLDTLKRYCEGTVFENSKFQ